MNVSTSTQRGDIMKKSKKKERRIIHPEYYAIKAYQILAKKSDEYMANALGVSVRTYTDKIKGYSDFKNYEAEILVRELKKTKDELFLT